MVFSKTAPVVSTIETSRLTLQTFYFYFSIFHFLLSFWVEMRHQILLNSMATFGPLILSSNFTKEGAIRTEGFQ